MELYTERLPTQNPVGITRPIVRSSQYRLPTFIIFKGWQIQHLLITLKLDRETVLQVSDSD